MKYRVMIGCLFTVLALAAATPARAANAAFGVMPLMRESAVQPGERATGAIELSVDPAPNAGAEAQKPVKLRVYAMDWTLDRAGQPQFLKAGSTPGSCSNWVQVSPAEVTVVPGETQVVRYTANVPSDAHGTYRTVLMFEPLETVSLPGSQRLQVRSRIGSTLYLQVGAQSRRARITKLDVTTTEAAVTVENTGTSHVRLKGMLQLHDAEGKLVQQIEFPGGVVLPGTEGVRDFKLQGLKLPGTGNFKATVILDYGGEALLGARTNVKAP